MASGQPVKIKILDAAIVYLLSEGFYQKEIAEKLCVCPDAVNKRVGRMYEKMELPRPTQPALISLGHDIGLIPDVREHIEKEGGFYGYKVR